ncbi:MAG: hypothetical protein ACPGU5_04135 [Lishizhenia sp.]
MRLLLIPALMLFAFNLSAQFFGDANKKMTVDRFSSTTTYIVKSESKRYNTNLKNGFDDFWELTDVKYVESLEDLDLKDESISYFTTLTITINDNLSEQSYPYLALVVGGKENLKQRVIATITLDNFGYERSAEEAAYRAYSFANIMQDYIQIKTENIKAVEDEYPGLLYKLYGAIYNKRSNVVKNKTLLVDEKLLSSGKYFPYKGSKSMSKEDFKKAYKGKVKFVDTDELESAINQRDEDYCYLRADAMRSKYVYIVDCNESKIVYKLKFASGILIKKKDLKTMSKEIL